MALVLHFGVRESEFEVLRNHIIRAVPKGIDPVVWNDGWPYSELMFDPPVHVTIETTTPMVILNFLASRYVDFLVPYSGEDKDGVLIYVTDQRYVVHDSKQNVVASTPDEYVELRYPE